MKIGIIAGNRYLPLLIAQRIKQKDSDCELIAFCFRGETSGFIRNYVDKTYWLRVGNFTQLKEALRSEGLGNCFVAGQINPLHIFYRKYWDKELTLLINGIEDFRPHTIFKAILQNLEKEGVRFLDSTIYLKEDLAEEGVMNGLSLTKELINDTDFGLKLISRFVELDVGQTIVIKRGSVIGLESLEGTDRTVKRAYRLGGRGCLVLKFSKTNQDLRFDVPVVGISTLKLLHRIMAAGLVLEEGKVIILNKQEFLSLAKKWGIPIIGQKRRFNF